jgi:pilus assembly protein CpaE
MKRVDDPGFGGGPVDGMSQAARPGAAAARVLHIATGIGPMPDSALFAADGVTLTVENRPSADLAGLDTRPGLDAIVVELQPGDGAQLAAFRALVDALAGRLPVIAAVAGLSVADTRLLLRNGAADAVALPLTPAELRPALEPVRRAPVARPAAQPGVQGRSIAFLGAIGGAGTTSLIAQAGILWAKRNRVCLIDLDLQFGNAALYLDLKPRLTLADLVEAGDRFDPELLQSVAVAHASGLSVVASPVDMVPLDLLSPAFVARLLETATRAFDLVLLDLPQAWTDWTTRALQRADVACLVTTTSVPGLHQARRQLDMFEANGLSGRLKLIANRVERGMFRAPDLKPVESVLSRRVDFAVAEDRETVTAAHDEGRPLAEIRRGSRVEKDLRALVDGLAAAVLTEGAPA